MSFLLAAAFKITFFVDIERQNYRMYYYRHMQNHQSRNKLENSVIYIGGVSSVGKTTVMQKLCKNIKHSSISLDHYSDLINHISSDVEITNPIKEKIAQQIIIDLIAIKSECVVEGVWIKPSVATDIRHKHNDKLTAIFCGHPKLDPQEHLHTIRKKGDHWLAHKPQGWALNFITESVEKSQWYKDQCELHEFPFIDFSNRETGTKELLNLFEHKMRKTN